MVQPQQAGGEEIMDLEDSRPLLRARQRHSGEGTASSGAVYAFLPGVYADFWLCGTSGLGSQSDLDLINTALQEKRPDVLLTQLCPTRMKLMLDPSAPWWSNLDGTFSRFLSLLCGKWVLRGMGALASNRTTMVGLEFVHSVRRAAGANIRVVLGERDLSTSMQRAWKYMNWYDRLRGVRDLAVLGVIPVPHSRWLLGLPQLSIGRQSDAAAEALRCLVERCPSLSTIEREHHDYLLSSIQKLDSAPSRYRMGGHLSPDERTIVLVVMGKGSVAYAQTHWNEQVDRKALVGKPVAGPGEHVGLLIVILLLIILAVFMFHTMYKTLLASLPPLPSSSQPLYSHSLP